jgi:hypothetical protein
MLILNVDIHYHETFRRRYNDKKAITWRIPRPTWTADGLSTNGRLSTHRLPTNGRVSTNGLPAHRISTNGRLSSTIWTWIWASSPWISTTWTWWLPTNGWSALHRLSTNWLSTNWFSTDRYAYATIGPA